MKNKRTHPQRIEMRKYCPRLKRHTLHRETR
ncbi:50S ribosomal protein L33 [Paenibacillus sp. IB182496]|uniref:Large ribosomal subunit protein bL33 n=1 Tax=Paenibacillus sabuli TaxID=2772509 RepID=A0A927BWP9_9BACL|nr:50S ribosomal protein L33 [Paenibacillus sabuli]